MQLPNLQLWERYFHHLVWLARRRLRPATPRAADEEDVALSAFASFCRGAAAGRIYGPNHPDTLLTANNLAWLLATTRDPQVRDPARAVELAKEIVQRTPKDGYYWNTLGAAYYAVGDWRNAITALEKSEELAPGEWLAWNGFFLAMAHSQLGKPGTGGSESALQGPRLTVEEQAHHKDEARNWYRKAVGWMEKNQSTDPELLQVRAEVAMLLGVPDTQAPAQKEGK